MIEGNRPDAQFCITIFIEYLYVLWLSLNAFNLFKSRDLVLFHVRILLLLFSSASSSSSQARNFHSRNVQDVAV